MYQSAGDPTLGFILAGAALLLILLPGVRAIQAGYGAIALFVIVEMVLVAMNVMIGRDTWIFSVGWGFAAVMSAIAIVGADIRRALEKGASTSVASASVPSDLARPT